MKRKTSWYEDGCCASCYCGLNSKCYLETISLICLIASKLHEVEIYELKYWNPQVVFVFVNNLYVFLVGPTD